jgi:hypothetical protein
MKVLLPVEISGSEIVEFFKDSWRGSGDDYGAHVEQLIIELDLGMADYDFTASVVKKLIESLAKECTKQEPLNMADFAPAKLHGD